MGHIEGRPTLWEVALFLNLFSASAKYIPTLSFKEQDKGGVFALGHHTLLQ